MRVFLSLDENSKDIFEISKEFFSIVEKHMNSINGLNIVFFLLDFQDDFKSLCDKVTKLDESHFTKEEFKIKQYLILCLKKIDKIFVKYNRIETQVFK